MKKTKNSTAPIFFIAHRGLSRQYPENTQAAFGAAWKSGCDGIELDIHVTKDGRVIVFHDADTLRMTGVKKEIKMNCYCDLPALNISSEHLGGEKKPHENIPLLSEVIDEMPTGKIVQIEIKRAVENIDAVVSTLAKIRRDICVQVISFDLNKLKQVREKLPFFDYFLITDSDTPPIIESIRLAREAGLTGIDLSYPMATAAHVNEALYQGLQIGAWTVNDIAMARSLIARGVRFITGDIVDQFLPLKEQLNND